MFLLFKSTISYACESIQDYQSLYFKYLISEYNVHLKILCTYADRQGFSQNNERDLTVLHELIHLDQAKHQGFKVINKGYTSFYVEDSTWGYVSVKYMLSKISKEKNNIYEQYLLPNENLVLGNLIDELNVYSIMLPYFIKYKDNDFVLNKQINNIAHFLRYINLYFYVLRTSAPAQYSAMRTIELKSFLKELFISVYTYMDKSLYYKVYEKNEVLLFLR